MKITSKQNIRERLPYPYTTILTELTGRSLTTVWRIVKNEEDGHRIWPVVEALADKGELAAREVAQKLGFIKAA